MRQEPDLWGNNFILTFWNYAVLLTNSNINHTKNFYVLFCEILDGKNRTIRNDMVYAAKFYFEQDILKTLSMIF